MLSPETQAIVNRVQLCDKKKEKVCLIGDINKAYKRLYERNLNTNEFDELYDGPHVYLASKLADMQYAIRCKIIDEGNAMTFGTL